jgi:hypothetical protein
MSHATDPRVADFERGLRSRLSWATAYSAGLVDEAVRQAVLEFEQYLASSRSEKGATRAQPQR